MGGVSGKDDGNTSGDYCSFGAAACADTGNLSFVLFDWKKAVWQREPQAGSVYDSCKCAADFWEYFHLHKCNIFPDAYMAGKVHVV